MAKEGIQARKFKNGLRSQIQKLVTAFEIPIYKEVVNKAPVIEKGLDNAQATKEKNLKKRAWSNINQNQNSKPHKLKAQKPNQVATEGKTQSRDAIKYYKCGGPRLTCDCTWLRGRGYVCGQEGYKAIVCPSGREPQKPRSSQKAHTNRAPQEGHNKKGDNRSL